MSGVCVCVCVSAGVWCVVCGVWVRLQPFRVLALTGRAFVRAAAPGTPQKGLFDVLMTSRRHAEWVQPFRQTSHSQVRLC